MPDGILFFPKQPRFFTFIFYDYRVNSQIYNIFIIWTLLLHLGPIMGQGRQIYSAHPDFKANQQAIWFSVMGNG